MPTGLPKPPKKNADTVAPTMRPIVPPRAILVFMMPASLKNGEVLKNTLDNSWIREILIRTEMQQSHYRR